ncbi:hypothetical protein SAMD00023353_2900320 [Rosellinia necatrix]|uniref:Uncharacterized protein n=1 Tax=Rosellinia necatrix TaxID=77044 RepID=A0A1W2TJJ5_ROSNE|nr:hypothetical protein SAMD00023353_2900320 [Rosellinia necatrix]
MASPSSSPSVGDPNQPDGDNDDTPTHHRLWPHLNDAFRQGRFERRFLNGETINFDVVPKTPRWMAWCGVPDSLRAMVVFYKVGSLAQGAGRPLTGDEATAVAQYSASSLSYAAWVRPISLLVAAGFALSGRRTFKFPLYRPRMIRFDPRFFPTRGIPLLKGDFAIYAWHAVRMAFYYPFVWFPATGVFSSIVETSFYAHILRDPRLAGMVEDINRTGKTNKDARRAAAIQQIRRQAGVANPTETAPTGETDHTTQPGGAFERPSGVFERSGTITEPVQNAQNDWAASTSTWPQPHGTQENVRPAPSPQYRRDDGDDSDLFEDDDASPVARSARGPNSGQDPPGRSGSSWDRIRQQGRSGNPNWEEGDSSGQERGWAQLRQDKTRNPKEGNPKADSYSYSNDDEERERRNYERAQAQKEFDAQIEAERRGEGSSSGGRGWRK